MMMSPCCIRAARSCRVLSTAAAGTISQATRGGFNFETKSSSDLAPIAPWSVNMLTFAAFISNTTHSCRSCSRRSTILAPILPNPIIPSCILISISLAENNRSRSRLFLEQENLCGPDSCFPPRSPCTVLGRIVFSHPNMFGWLKTIRPKTVHGDLGGKQLSGPQRFSCSKNKRDRLRLFSASEMEMSMQLGMIGLGRMGANMVERLLHDRHECVVFDMKAANVSMLTDQGAIGARSLDDLVSKLKPPRVAWLMVPAAAVDNTLHDLAARMQQGDIIIDGGNSHYIDDIRRADELKTKGIHYVD